MDFSNRNTGQQVKGARPEAVNPEARDGVWKTTPQWLKVAWVTLLFAATVLLAGIVTLMIMGGGERESGMIKKDKLQAVFLENGQVYFGKIRAISNDYVDLQGIYYLSVDQPIQPEHADNASRNITLQKLGCELHGPADQMIINRNHVTFWENLRDDGQVAKAVTQWLEKNPEGLKCDNNGQNGNNESSNGTNGSRDENGQDQ